ncbi:hypothetical protein DB30_03741 [Enhygromyxa salina]|uniref:Outer membrane protein beta-barrel domain-containing protein n=1 Tax=Enhygromyxa salina TaxID=215803 RepID=A0A0C1ZHS2_9BACT|nr:hypothetical protein [Enhygromyxa salina]KIG17144.1 hypothetical protein DB30_03741 [Enhygromyxa salina]
MLAAVWVWAAINLAPPDEAELPEPADPSAQPEQPDPSVAGGVLQISPLGVAVPGVGATNDLRALNRAVQAGYRWGFSVGVALEPVNHLLVSVSAGFNQTIWVFDNDVDYQLCFANDCFGTTERGLGNLIRVGPELRVGWTSRWWMAWALLGAHVGVSRVRLSCDNSVEVHCDRNETDVGAGLGGGLGLAIRPLPRFAIGLESAIVHTWLDRRDDPFEAARAWELGFVAVIGF